MSLSTTDEPRNVHRVMFPLPLPGPLDYAAAPGTILTPGDIVRAPLGGRTARGVIWPGSPERRDGLKFIETKLDVPALKPDLMAFVDWCADYVMQSPGVILRMAIRSSDAPDGRPKVTLYRAVDMWPEGLRETPSRRRLFARAGQAPALLSTLAADADCSTAVARGLVQAGALVAMEADADAPFDAPAPARAGVVLEPEQAEAARMLRETVAQGGYACTLLEGVTGSGKTEVYFEAVAQALAQDPDAQILILLPEIALTEDVIARVTRRFGAAPAAWHSESNAKARRRAWRRVAEGQARIVVGARSALFLPFARLRLIVVDEEHDGSYKQDEGAAYQGRDMAVARAHQLDAPVILASATPSLETRLNAEAGRYQRVRLTQRRGGRSAPAPELVDLRTAKPEVGRWLSPPVVEAAAGALNRGEQALFFLNRRGYAPITLCRSCGEPLRAPDSDTLLVYHRFDRRLVCHHTGYAMPMPKACPACGAVDSFAPCGPGVERVAEEVQERWPQARVLVVSSDTIGRGAAARRALDAIRDGEVDLIVGTQMLAKGHNFPNLTVAAVVDADLGLKGGDLRAGERTFQLMTQAAGRAGRAERPGRALIQTMNPDAPALRALASGDADAFYAHEAEARKALGFPPFGRLAAVVVASEDHRAAEETARMLGRNAPNDPDVAVWGPAPAPIALLRGRARWRLLVKTSRRRRIQPILRRWLASTRVPNRVRVAIDVDPYSFL